MVEIIDETLVVGGREFSFGKDPNSVTPAGSAQLSSRIEEIKVYLASRQAASDEEKAEEPKV